MPKNLLILTERLPQKNYDTKDFPNNIISTKNNHSNFPEILSRKSKVKKKDKDNNTVAIDHEAFFTQEDDTRSRKKKPKDLNNDIKHKVESLINAKPTVHLEKERKNYEDNKSQNKSPVHNGLKTKEINLPRNDSVGLNLPAINLAEILDKKTDKKIEKNDYYSMEK